MKQTEWKNNGEDSFTFNGDIVVDVPENPGEFTVLVFQFTQPILKIDVWDAEASALDRDSLFWAFAPKYRDKYETLGGTTWQFNFMGTSSSEGATATGLFCNKYPPYGQFGEKTNDAETVELLASQAKRIPFDDSKCNSSKTGSYPTQPANPEPKWKPMNATQLDYTNDYDLNEVLAKSILFYEAQRAGPLNTQENRIPYRGSSTLNDGCKVAANLEGGWFDAGDHVKFALPGAWSATILAYGLIDYHPAYYDAGEIQNAVYGLKSQGCLFNCVHLTRCRGPMTLIYLF